MDDDLHASFRVDLKDVRSLEISYSRARPDKADLAVEYVGGWVKAFVVDKYSSSTGRLDPRRGLAHRSSTSENTASSRHFGE